MKQDCPRPSLPRTYVCPAKFLLFGIRLQGLDHRGGIAGLGQADDHSGWNRATGLARLANVR